MSMTIYIDKTTSITIMFGAYSLEMMGKYRNIPLSSRAVHQRHGLSRISLQERSPQLGGRAESELP